MLITNRKLRIIVKHFDKVSKFSYHYSPVSTPVGFSYDDVVNPGQVTNVNVECVSVNLKRVKIDFTTTGDDGTTGKGSEKYIN